jgi:hypothetical protein
VRSERRQQRILRTTTQPKEEIVGSHNQMPVGSPDPVIQFFELLLLPNHCEIVQLKSENLQNLLLVRIIQFDHKAFLIGDTTPEVKREGVPWQKEVLLKEFFDGLAETLDQSLGSLGKTAGQFLAKYGGALQAIPLIGAGLSNTAVQVGKDISTDSLQNQRARAVEIMRGATRTVVVLIDDLDRLDCDDVMTALKLVQLYPQPTP